MNPDIRKAIAISLVVQGLGSLAPLLTLIALARIAGPEVQGTFSTFKFWMDLASSLVVFGFPQAFIYLINKGVCQRGQLLSATIFYVAGATILTVPLAAISLGMGYTTLPAGQVAWLHCFMLAVGMAALYLNRLVRGIYLTINDGLLFSLITSVPAFFLMTTTVAAGTQTPFRYDLAFLIAGVLTIVATWPWISRIIRETPGWRLRLEPLPFGILAHQSGHSFLQSLALTLQPVAATFILQQRGADLKAVAFFSASTLIVVAVNVLFGLVSPILFNRWSASMDASGLRRIGRVSLVLALIFAGLGLMAVPLLPLIVPLVFGADYAGAIWAFQAMALATAPVAYTRVMYPAIYAAGHVRLNTVSCAVRLGSALIAQVGLTSAGIDLLVAAVWSWIIAEWTSAFYSVITSLRIGR